MELSRTRSPADLGAALLRIALGVMYLSHAGLKIFVFTLPGTAQFFESVGFPGWSVFPVVAAELAGGALLIAGWRTRLVALSLVPILVGAAIVHWPNGWVFTAQGGGWEFPAYLIVLSVVQALIGDGAFALRVGGRAGAPAVAVRTDKKARTSAGL